ncbi:MAG: response regulator [Nitrospira sp.]|nr:response regulator [Nitrospira sp.]
MRILLVEDDADLATSERVSGRALCGDVASNGEQGFELGIANPYDLIIPDIMPQLDGLSLCRRLRDTGVTAPVLLLTARDTVQDMVSGLDLGADDVI